MSNVKIKANASGTGTLTIAAPNTNTDRTLTLPDAAGEILTNATGLTSSSSLNAANLTGTLPAIDGSALTGISGFEGSWSSTSASSGVTYTNTSGAYQFVNCYGGATGSSGRYTGDVKGYVDGIQIAWGASRGYLNHISNITLIVPPSSTWRFDVTGTTGFTMVVKTFQLN
jgi:hypothetical protein